MSEVFTSFISSARLHIHKNLFSKINSFISVSKNNDEPAISRLLQYKWSVEINRGAAWPQIIYGS